MLEELPFHGVRNPAEVATCLSGYDQTSYGICLLQTSRSLLQPDGRLCTADLSNWGTRR
jgi:hypothetical protein